MIRSGQVYKMTTATDAIIPICWFLSRLNYFHQLICYNYSVLWVFTVKHLYLSLLNLSHIWFLSRINWLIFFSRFGRVKNGAQTFLYLSSRYSNLFKMQNVSIIRPVISMINFVWDFLINSAVTSRFRKGVPIVNNTLWITT